MKTALKPSGGSEAAGSSPDRSLICEAVGKSSGTVNRPLLIRIDLRMRVARSQSWLFTPSTMITDCFGCRGTSAPMSNPSGIPVSVTRIKIRVLGHMIRPSGLAVRGSLFHGRRHDWGHLNQGHRQLEQSRIPVAEHESSAPLVERPHLGEVIVIDDPFVTH